MSSTERKPKEEDSTPSNDEAIEVSRSTRYDRPAHYMLKIDSYSVLSESSIEKYESGEFEACGFKWKLCFYPNGDKKRNGGNHISLYLVISDTDSLPNCWEVNVQFKLFVYNNILDKFLTVQDLFKYTANGYLSDDACVLGAEVQVVGYVDTKKHSRPSPSRRKLLVDPKGSGDCKGKSLSIFLQLADYATLPPHTRVYAEYKLATKSQTTGKNSETKCTAWFCDSKGNGRRNFMWLNDLNDKSKGYIVSDSLIIEVVFIIIGIAKNCG
ncbi:hypothetical protein LguiB_022004 [Lonicera macranthoides]